MGDEYARDNYFNFFFLHADRGDKKKKNQTSSWPMSNNSKNHILLVKLLQKSTFT